MTNEEAISYYEEVAEVEERLYRLCPASESEMFHCNGTTNCKTLKNGKNKGCLKCSKEYRQLAEWLKELKAYRELADWLVKAVLEEDWEEDAGFNAEVICRKLTKLGKLKVVDNKYMEVNADEQ